MGATASAKIRVLNRHIIEALAIPSEIIERVEAKEQREVKRCERRYCRERPPALLEGKIVILVDDGLATGSTMRVAVLALRQRKPARLIVAVPVSAASTCEEFKDEVDEIVCAITPEPFLSVSQWYDEFTQTSDAEVCALLNRAYKPDPSAVSAL